MTPSSILSDFIITPSGVTDYLQFLLPEEITEYLTNSFNNFASIDEFQLQILRVSFFILCINLVFILIVWKKFGEKITERFMKPASSKSLEELKREATELKLPKEHTPRI
ncbi:hypothetical protein JTE90_006621 [Oedothorax gibbosus]|uniref:Uncharacterized protein n=1 Tax=Oedothorax gibbosus TaxID=931172 RepID=A0AAV6U7Q3_9ARAC|nr:hypothetical protein JTE90_006621 [Oedothorax gibbosus]